MNTLLTTNGPGPNHVIKYDIEISETVIQEQLFETGIEKNPADENVKLDRGRISEAKHDLTQREEDKARMAVKCFQCPNCLMLFDNPKLVESHMKETHVEIQKLESCPICSLNFQCKSDLFDHMNSHREKLCAICNVVISNSEALKNHVESLHTGNLEFICLICFKMSIDSASHNDHVSTHNVRQRYECVDCSKNYASLEGLERHRQTHGGIVKKNLKSQYKCSICSKAYSTRRTLRYHLNTHTGTRPYKCGQCPKNYFSPAALQLHRKEHSSLPRKIIERKFKCSYCLKSFCRQQDLRSHVNSHTGERPFKCNECLKTYKTRQALYSHRQSHSLIKCSICSKTLRSMKALRYHMNVHTDTRPYQCDQCPRSFHSPGSLKRHRQGHSEKAKSKKYKCDLCLDVFTGLSSLHLHMNSHNDACLKCNQCEKAYARRGGLECVNCSKNNASLEGLERYRQTHGGIVKNNLKSQYKCAVCSKAYSRQRTLHNHMNTHKGTRPYKCDQCPKNYFSPEALQHHRKTHLSLPIKIIERKFKCSYCLKSYCNRRDLRSHVNNHTGERPFKCNECLKTYKTPQALHSHRQSHSPIKCSICSMSLRSMQALRYHMNVHTDTRPYQCDQCPDSFHSPGFLRQHRQGHSKKAESKKCIKDNALSCDLNGHRKKHLMNPDECKAYGSDKSLHGEDRNEAVDKIVDLHTALAKYKCNECGKEFISERNLRFHLRLHVKELIC